ncbi:MAG TPA: hypothetical protein DIW36_06060 [Ruminococcaceae bacterium]|nr:hypothetical protein [Oscillospiraceae bacterium]HCT16935.1 hypothetical protein [Oscillospiraceae bacterium]
MPVYKIAGLNVGYEPRYDLLRLRSEKYLCDEKAEFKIGISDDMMEQQINYYKDIMEGANLEYLWVGTAFNLKLLEYNGMYLHSSTVVVDGKAYSFSAPCRTGKSTHTSLWLKMLGDRAYIINDDKAAFRKIDGKFYVFGTPFSGKNDINVNTFVELGGICFVEQSETNSIERLSNDEALSLLISQTVRPSNPDRMILLCDFLDDLLKNVPIYKLKCNISLEAAELSYKTMSRRLL